MEVKEIKTIDAVETYALLKNVKLSKIESNDLMMALWKILKQLKEVDTTYNNDVVFTKESIVDDTHKEWETKLYFARSREEQVKRGEYTMTPEDIKEVNEINEYFGSLSEKVSLLLDGLKEKEVKIGIDGITTEDLLEIGKIADFSFDVLEKIEWICG